MTHGYRVRVSTTGPSRMLPGKNWNTRIAPTWATCQYHTHVNSIGARLVFCAGLSRSCKSCVGVSQSGCLHNVWNDPTWTLSINSSSSLWHSTKVHHVCNSWHDSRPGPRLSLHTITHSSPGQEQSVGGTTPRWHATLLVSYNCYLRGTEHDTGGQRPRSVVPATCEPSPTLWHVANKLAEPSQDEGSQRFSR